MKKRELTKLALKTLAAATLLTGALGTFGIASAQTKLKWAHVYETSEAYHKWALWAAEEIGKRTNGRYLIEVFPASSLGKESDIVEGLNLRINLCMRKAYGYRSFELLKVSLFHTLGELPEPEFTHRFC